MEEVQAMDRVGRIYHSSGKSRAGAGASSATLYDRPLTTLYTIYYDRREVELSETGAKGPALPVLTKQQEHELASRSTLVKDIPCVKMDNFTAGPDRKPQRIGYNMHLLRTRRDPGSPGEPGHARPCDLPLRHRPHRRSLRGSRPGSAPLARRLSGANAEPPLGPLINWSFNP
jgi:hypothetical protein